MPETLEKTSRFVREIIDFSEFEQSTRETELKTGNDSTIPVFTNEFWTAKQRDAHSLHEVSYRACFKPQLPRFFIERLTSRGDCVFDPFMGRGTTLIEAALLGRKPAGTDINPLSLNIIRPRLQPPSMGEIEDRLKTLPIHDFALLDEGLFVFYHPDTLQEITSLRQYLLNKEGSLDHVDEWIRMVATNRLTGHSKGFFSVYTLPPNQAVSIKSQIRINEKRQQKPEYRSISERILKKSKSLLKDLDLADRKNLQEIYSDALLLNESSDRLTGVADESVSLVVTSPPFLDVVNYSQDNWLRCWFNGIDSNSVPIWQLNKIEKWEHAMEQTLLELKRILKPGAHVAFEVGEVRKGKIKLEEHVVRVAQRAGLTPVLVMLNIQNFTKTAACWGVDNLQKGTNSNRIVVLQKQ